MWLGYQIIKPNEEIAKSNRPKRSTISLLNTDGKNPPKIIKTNQNKANLANQIQHSAKRIIHHNQVGFTAGKRR